MKKYLLFLLIISGLRSFAQNASYQNLDINKVKASFNASGDLSWDLVANPSFEFPKGSGKHTIFAGNLWIGGLANSGPLHVAAQVYRQMGNDFYPGPLNINSGQTSATYVNQFNKIWKINKSSIDSLIAYNLDPSSMPGYVIPNSILDWPGNGPYFNGYDTVLAPFFDENSDHFYDPNSGDYPLIKGDQALFFVYNDNYTAHGESGGIPMKVEIQALAYAFNCIDSALSNTIFVDYKIINRSANSYTNTYLGNWLDFDLGDFSDDKLGCDVGRNCFFTYNGDNQDGSGSGGTYGVRPPAQAVVVLEAPTAKPLSKFITYFNSMNTNGNPDDSTHYYDYLRARWKDGNPLTYGGNGLSTTGTPCNYMFPGTTDSANGNINWVQTTAGDLRGVGSSGPFTFIPGQEINYKIAYVTGRDYATSGNNMTSLNIAMNYVDSIRSRFNSGNWICQSSPLALSPAGKMSSLIVYPNPASGLVYIKSSEQINSLEIFTADSKSVRINPILDKMNDRILDLSNLPAGFYFIKIQTPNGTTTERLVISR